MATVKEVKLMKDGAMVTPVVLADSVKNSDGTKYKDSIYTKTEVDSKVSTINTVLAGKTGFDTSPSVIDLPIGDTLLGYLGNYTCKLFSRVYPVIIINNDDYTDVRGNISVYTEPQTEGSITRNLNGYWICKGYDEGQSSQKRILIQRIE